MNVDLLDCMGSDLSVCNIAKVSFNKETNELGDREERLIAYLAKHGHWSPFSHPQLSFRVQAPIFVARQLCKHTVGLTWNEVSRRYVDEPPEFFAPLFWRGRATDKKQGSSEKSIPFIEKDGNLYSISDIYKTFIEKLVPTLYKDLIEAGVCPEQARMVLPQSTYTSWIWTGSLYAFARVCTLRCKSDAQAETRVIADAIKAILREKFPVSCRYLLAE